MIINKAEVKKFPKKFSKSHWKQFEEKKKNHKVENSMQLILRGCGSGGEGVKHF